MGKKFITAALPYVNNQPHLGNIVGSVLGADVYTRYCKKCGDDAVYVCGTDEYGTATEMEAMKQGIHPREIVEKNRKLHKQVYDWLNLKFDSFGNTDCEAHIALTQEFFRKCYDNGYFEHREITQFYCEKCDQFLADRYVEGVCKLCGYSGARGDQCDKCGKCLKPEDLVEPKCALCSSTPAMKKTKHLFLRLDALQEKIKMYFANTKNDWSANARDIYEEWMKKGIHARCMTRLLKYKWGVQVPLEGYEDKVFYVWFDAPIGYFTFLSQIKPAWLDWVSDAKFIQFMGKDNVPFHSIIFPGMIIAALDKTVVEERIGSRNIENLSKSVENLNINVDCRGAYPIVDVINSTEYLQFSGEKFSKSRNVGIFGMDLVTKDLGCADIWRYYLIKRRPEIKDSDFNTEDFISQVTGDLISNLGNFCNRILKYINKNLEGVPAIDALDSDDKKLISDVNRLYDEYKKLIEGISLRDALGKVFEISSCGNRYLQELQRNKAKMKHGYSLCCSLIVFLAYLVDPFMPTASSKMFLLCNASNGNFPAQFDVVKDIKVSEDITVLFTHFTEVQLSNIRGYSNKK